MNAPYVSTTTIATLLPEIVLIGAATAIYVAGAFVRSRSAWSWLGGIALATAAVCCYLQTGETDTVRAGSTTAASPLLADGLMTYVRWLALGTGALLLLTAQGAAQGQPAEYVGSLLLVVAGTMLVASVGDLVMLFLGLELISIPTYVLLYLGRRNVGSQEAAAKYFYLSILSSAVMLYGFSFLYGVAGSMHLDVIHDRLKEQEFAQSAWLPLTGVALVLTLAGLGFRMAAVPFHFYAPDVYQGTTHANAALLSVMPKLAGVAALARVASLFEGAGRMEIAWILVLSLAVATMTVGNVLGLWQDNLRRLMAYSSIAHAGYLLIGVAVGFAANIEGLTPGFDGLQAALFYVAVYALATIGVFALLGYLGSSQPERANLSGTNLSSDDRQIDDIDELSGLGQTRPWAALALSVLLLSLAGMPPLAGFLGKLTLFYSAIGLQSADSRLTVSFVVLAIAGGLNAAIAAGYYLRVIGAMYFGAEARRPAAAGGRGALAAVAVSLALVIGLGLFPSQVMRGAEHAAKSLKWPPPRQGSPAAP
jgi:NADH-quinone oxidoreductase subunit N